MYIRTNEKVVVSNPDHPNYGHVYFFAFTSKGPNHEDRIFVTKQRYEPSTPNIGLTLFPGEVDVLEKKETD
jgi:hypothetical protein